eukprot:Clim_evm47s199 gene=Clim_evmTU47s199
MSPAHQLSKQRKTIEKLTRKVNQGKPVIPVDAPSKLSCTDSESQQPAQYKSSVAGASSADFDIYRNERDRERQRLAALAAEKQRDLENEEFRKKHEQNMKANDARTAKKRAKREKQRQKLRDKKKSAKS